MVSSQCSKSGLNKEMGGLELFIEADKLHTIQVSIERFLENWTKRKLVELETPQQFEKHGELINFAQWVNRFALTSAGVLTLNGHPKIGGSVSIFYPLIELLISFLKEKIEKKSKSWGEFFKFSEKLANNLDRLLVITESIKNISSGDLNSASKKLNNKIYDFLKEYDKNKDKKIEISELKINKFVRDLKENWRKGKEKNLREIVQEIQFLQRKLFNYRHHL